VIAALLLSPGILNGQAPVTVRGRVIDLSTRAPIAGARCVMGDATTGTDDRGFFDLHLLSAGTVVLTVTAVGYAPGRATLDLTPGVPHEVTVTLTPSVARLPEIAVQGQAAGPTLDHQALVRRGEDLATAMDGWQGIVVRRSGGNGPASPQIRGSAPEEVIVLVDGFAVNDPLTGRADLGKISSRDVASVQVRPGAQAAGGAGSAIGGVIEIRSMAPSPGWTASSWAASHGSAGGSLAGTVGATRLFLRAERLPEGFLYEVPPNRGGGQAARLNAGGTVGALNFRSPGPVALSGRASFSSRGLPGPVGNETPGAKGRDLTAFLGIAADGTIAWSGSLQYLTSEVSDTAPPTGLAYDARSEGWSGTLDGSRRVPVALATWEGELEVGASARHDRFWGDVVRDETSFSRGALRALATLRPAEDSPWTLTPAVRLDLWTGRDGPLASARVDAAWLHGGTSVRGGVGSAVAAPALADLFFREGVGVALNPALRPERVRWEVELGVTQDWTLAGRPATASVQGYYGLVDDMVLWAPGVGFIWSPGNYDVIRRGLEASISMRPLETVSLEVQGALTPITYDVPDGAQVQYRPRETWGAAAAWANAGWSADVRWRWVGERFPNPGGVNPRPAFGVLNAGGERAFGPALVRGEVRDVLDARPEYLAGYPTPGRTVLLSVSMEWQ